MLPECFRVARERMVVRESFRALAQKQDPDRFFWCSLDLNPFPGLHVMDVLGNLAGMIGTPFKVPGDHDVVCAARDIFRIFHHVGNPFPEDRVPEGIDRIITG
jgi:hypothetical protein